VVSYESVDCLVCNPPAKKPSTDLCEMNNESAPFRKESACEVHLPNLGVQRVKLPAHFRRKNHERKITKNRAIT
jgi:hypothetical protein